MRNLVLAAVLASTSVFAFGADAPSLTGKWSVHTSVAGNDSDSVCTLTQTDATLSGTCKSDNGEGKASGKVDGTKVTWSYDTEYNGSPLTIEYTGNLDSAASKITGTVNIAQFGVDGDFTATLSK